MLKRDRSSITPFKHRDCRSKIVLECIGSVLETHTFEKLPPADVSLAISNISKERHEGSGMGVCYVYGLIE